MNKKLFSILLLLSTTLFLNACSEGCISATKKPDCKNNDLLCIGLVTDMGTIDDKSFNQSAWEGVQHAVSELGAHANYIETRDAKDYMANIHNFLK